MTDNSKTSHIIPIIRLSIPLIIGQLGIIVQQFADTAMVGHYSTDSLSAAGFVGTVFNIAIFFLLGISYSTTPVAGAFFGRGDMEGTSRTLRESLVVNFATSLLVVIPLAWLYMHLDILNQPEELLPLARPYFLTLLISLPFLAIFNSLKQFSDALGQTRTPMWVMLAANGLNICLNLPLIFGFDTLGIPALGLWGAGIATLASRVFMAATMALLVFKRQLFQSAIKTPVSMTKDGLKHLWIIGLPISLQLCLETASFNVSGIFMGWIGAIPLAAHQVMCTISTLCFMVVYGIGAATAIRISQYAGRGEWEEVHRVAYTAFGLALCCVVCIATCIVVNIHTLASFFTSSNEVVMVICTLLLPFVFYQFGDCMQIIFANVLRGIARVRNMMFYAFIAYVVVSLPLSYFFAFVLGGGAVGVWWGFPFGLTTAGLLFLRDFLKK